MTQDGEPVGRWTEDDSEVYARLAPVAIPARDEQIATIVALLPFGTDAHFTALDLGAGEGALSFAILETFPNATLIALDGSEVMRDRAVGCLARFGDRAAVQPFELGSFDWLPFIDSSNVVTSSLVLHHIEDSQKPLFFDMVYERMLEPGALMIADILQAQRQEQTNLMADTYDAVVLAQSLAINGSDEAYKVFADKKWNFFRYGFATPGEHPFCLADSLRALQAAGFDGIDCFWQRAGFVVFGGYKGPAPSSQGVSWEAALRAARLGLSVISTLRQNRAG